VSTYEATVQSAFTASHDLPLPAGGREESHKHTWVVTAAFRAHQLDETMNVVIDFTVVLDVLGEIAALLEDCNLNDLPDFIDGRPSAERVAALIADRLSDALSDLLGPPGGDDPWLHRVEVTEAPGCVAVFLP
jgi:6-pyruvoyl-tetrahydropterin synthase